MTRRDLLRLLAELPTYSDQHDLHAIDMAFITEVRLSVGRGEGQDAGVEERLVALHRLHVGGYDDA